jgi:hypothetical protein
MNFIAAHPVVSAIIACYTLSTLVDALKQVPPQPGDSRLFIFAYAFLNGIAGNAITALNAFLARK